MAKVPARRYHPWHWLTLGWPETIYFPLIYHKLFCMLHHLDHRSPVHASVLASCWTYYFIAGITGFQLPSKRISSLWFSQCQKGFLTLNWLPIGTILVWLKFLRISFYYSSSTSLVTYYLLQQVLQWWGIHLTWSAACTKLNFTSVCILCILTSISVSLHKLLAWTNASWHSSASLPSKQFQKGHCTSRKHRAGGIQVDERGCYELKRIGLSLYTSKKADPSLSSCQDGSDLRPLWQSEHSKFRKACHLEETQNRPEYKKGDLCLCASPCCKATCFR